jgi:protein O-GlcNAc transferase
MSNGHNSKTIQKALSLHQRGDIKEAAKLYRRLIKTNPNHSYALHFLGLVEASVGNIEEAKLLMARSLSTQPSNITFVENYATILFRSRDYKSALQVCREGLKLNDANPPLLYGSAISLFKLSQLQESLRQFDKLLLLQPSHIVAHNERGSVLSELKQHDAALASFDKALSLNPLYAEAHLNKGNLYGILENYDAALSAYDKALAIKPDLPDAWLGRGNVFRLLKRYDESIAAYDKALALQPDCAEVLVGLGNVFYDLKRYDTSIAAYDKALALKPDLPDGWLGRGNACADLKRYSEAFNAYDKALVLKANLKDVEGRRLYAKLLLSNWKNFDVECANLISAIKDGKVNASPFHLLAIPSSAGDQLQCAKLWTADKYPASESSAGLGKRYDHDRIRLAYLSADFRGHAVSSLLAGVFECQDKSLFDVTALSLGPDTGSEMRGRLKASFNDFIDVSTYSDGQISGLIKEMEIDILVDLMGFTEGSRTGVFARRPAPIQVNYLGYLGTMGAEYIDYIIADRTVIPESQVSLYAEKAVYLPNSFQPTDRKRRISDKMLTRGEVGLPKEGFVFCCFNANYKITPEIYDIWMRILRQVDGSVLWLFANNAETERNLRSEAAARGISAERLIFAPAMPLPEHQARLQLADLFLDTLPYNAGATASDALWAGLPILTRVGDTFVGRMAASVLNAIDLRELITTTPKAYEALAIDLSGDPRKLVEIKQKLARNRLTTALFDTNLYTKHIQSAYTIMYERYQCGSRPDHISISN